MIAQDLRKADSGVPRVAILTVAIWLGLYAAGLAMLRGSAAQTFQSDILYAVPDFVGGAVASWVVLYRREALGTRLTPAVACIGLSCGLSFVADMVYAGYYYFAGRNDVYPSWADPVWLLSDLALIAAIMYAFPGVTAVRRLRGSIDGGVAALGLASALWTLNIADGATGGTMGAVFSVAYPVMDAVMLVLLLSVGVSGHRRLALPLTLLGAGCCVLVATDLTYAYLNSRNEYGTGSWLDLGWQASAGLTLLAVISAGSAKVERVPRTRQAPGSVAGMPDDQLVLDRDMLGLAPLCVGVAGAFVVVAQSSTGRTSTPGLLLAGATVLAVMARLVLSIVDQRAISRRLDTALAEQKQLAITDMLTELYNRRFTEELLRLETARAVRGGGRLAVVIVDLDHFKVVNDTHGHQAGDVALAEAAARLRRALRDSDVLGRWGGEEFLAVLRDADAATALQVAERARTMLSAETIRLVDGTRVTLTASAGVACIPGNATDVDTLLWQADQALYTAKQDGRDRVCLATFDVKRHELH